MPELELLGPGLLRSEPPPSFVGRELLAYCTTFRPVPLAFLGPYAGLRGRLLSIGPGTGGRGEALVGGQPRTLAARLWLLPCGGRRCRIRQFQVQDAGHWVWLVRNSEVLPQRIWDALRWDTLRRE